MPNVQGQFPGAFRKDYRFVSYGGKTYVVYSLRLPGGKAMEVSWRLDADAIKDFGVRREQIQHISEARFKRMETLGNWAEVSTGLLPDEHPFQTWLKNLQRLHGEVSWLSDSQFIGQLVEGYAEGWSDAELQQSLEQTKWYQSRTDAQRAWELDTSKGDRRASIKNTTQQVSDALRELYGADFNLKDAGITQDQIKKWAEQVASGKWGDPSSGFQTWLSRERTKAEEIEGTPAWISREQDAEEQRAFLNRPEDVFVQLKDMARQWLGPLAVPSDGTLKQWAADIVSEKKSDGDWQTFLQKRAQRLYPFLDADTPWQEFADPYKSLLENSWGTSVKWDNPLLQQLGQVDDSGAPTGAALSFYDFEVLARQDPQFWGGSVAREEGYGLLNKLNEVFRGVTR